MLFCNQNVAYLSQSEREKLSSQEATTARIEEMLQDMKDGATSLDDRLAHFEALLAAKEAEKRELLETTGQLRGELAAAKSRWAVCTLLFTCVIVTVFHVLLLGNVSARLLCAMIQRTVS
jgi:hypothetical protein